MKFEVEHGADGRDHWRLVITTPDLAREDNRLDRRLRLVGGNVRAKLDDSPRRSLAKHRWMIRDGISLHSG